MDRRLQVTVWGGTVRTWIPMMSGAHTDEWYLRGWGRRYVLAGRPLVAFEEQGRTRATLEEFYGRPMQEA